MHSDKRRPILPAALAVAWIAAVLAAYLINSANYYREKIAIFASFLWDRL